MTERILVPLDGSPRSERVLGAIQPALRRPGAEAYLLRILEEPGEDKRSWARKDEVARARAHLERIQDRLARKGIAAVTAIRSGDPVQEILSFALRLRPAAIAMSTHGRTGLTRLARGSVAEEILRASPHPVLLVNAFAGAGPARRPGPARILVPIDLAVRTEPLLAAVEKVAQAFAAHVVLLHAEPGPAFRSYPLVEAAWRRLRKAGVEAMTYTVRGRADGAILRTAAAGDFDLIAMATHGRSGADRWLHGSVTESVLRRARCPVLTVRAKEVPEGSRPPRRREGPGFRWVGSRVAP